MKSTRIAFLTAVLVSVPATADILSLPTGGYGVTETSNSAPRGATEGEVLQLFGEPQRRFQPVGDPAISSWQYDKFRVYFENGLVLHTVVVGL